MNPTTPADNLTTSFTVGDRTYELVSFFKEGEEGDCYVCGGASLDRAKELGADLDHKDAFFILEHEDEIPAVLREMVMVFPRWRANGKQLVGCLEWRELGWYHGWRYTDHHYSRDRWNSCCRLVRRVK